jgi:uncharacterized protein (TIGR03435 family)
MSNNARFRCVWAVACALISGFISGPNLFGQPPAPPKLEFEVASVRPSAPSVDRYDVRFSPSSLTYTGVTLKLLIRTAYRIQDMQIIGGPPWLNSARFDISGKIEGNRTPPEILEMLKQLLEDRFHLVLRKEVRNQPHYSMVTAGSPSAAHPGLKKAGEFECINGRDNSRAAENTPICGAVSFNKTGSQVHFAARGIPMSQLALIFTGQLNAWVENNTGLEGNYEIQLTYADDQIVVGPNAGVDDPGPSVFTALQEQLGLKLQSVKGPVDVFVVDRAEIPAEN